MFVVGFDEKVVLVLNNDLDMIRLSNMLDVRKTAPSYEHTVGDTVLLAPPEPLLHKCPECEANEDEGVANRKKSKIFGIPRKTYRLTYTDSTTEQWGSVVTRHDYYKCRHCRSKFVSTNGRSPEITTD